MGNKMRINTISLFIFSLIILNEVSLNYGLFLNNIHNQKTELQQKISKMNIWENFAGEKNNFQNKKAIDNLLVFPNAESSNQKIEFQPQKIYSSMLRSMNPEIISSNSNFLFTEKKRTRLDNKNDRKKNEKKKFKNKI